MHEFLEFVRLVTTEFFDGDLLLLFLDGGVLLGLRSTRETLPRQRATQEVEDDVTDSLEVITSRLLVTQMGVDRGIAGRSREVLAVTEGNVLAVR